MPLLNKMAGSRGSASNPIFSIHNLAARIFKDVMDSTIIDHVLRAASAIMRYSRFLNEREKGDTNIIQIETGD